MTDRRQTNQPDRSKEDSYASYTSKNQEKKGIKKLKYNLLGLTNQKLYNNRQSP